MNNIKPSMEYDFALVREIVSDIIISFNISVAETVGHAFISDLIVPQ